MDIDINQQVMGPDESSGNRMVVPRFKYDGGNPARFLQDFALVAAYFKVAEPYEWEADRELTGKERLMDVRATVVLRQYLCDDVLQVVMLGRGERASVLYGRLKEMFLTYDARTKVQVQRELQVCDMKLGETLVGFLGRINKLFNELGAMGEVQSDEVRMVTVAARLREPWRTHANGKMDREPDMTYNEFVKFLMLKQQGETADAMVEGVYLAAREAAPRGRTGRTAGAGEASGEAGSGAGSAERQIIL
jgi:hypothetical protein